MDCSPFGGTESLARPAPKTQWNRMGSSDSWLARFLHLQHGNEMAHFSFFLFCPECIQEMHSGQNRKKGGVLWSGTQDGASLVLGCFRAVPPGTPGWNRSLRC